MTKDEHFNLIDRRFKKLKSRCFIKNYDEPLKYEICLSYFKNLKEGFKCEYCKNAMCYDDYESPRLATLDHKVPLCNGGTHKSDNIVICCLSCNTLKGSKSLIEFDKLLNDTSDISRMYLYNYIKHFFQQLESNELKYLKNNNISKVNDVECLKSKIIKQKTKIKELNSQVSSLSNLKIDKLNKKIDKLNSKLNQQKEKSKKKTHKISMLNEKIKKLK